MTGTLNPLSRGLRHVSLVAQTGDLKRPDPTAVLTLAHLMLLLQQVDVWGHEMSMTEGA